MKTARIIKSSLAAVALLQILFSTSVYSQGYDPKLTIQGLDKYSSQSAVSVSLGGSVFSQNSDAGLLFANPAGLIGITQPVLSAGNLYKSSTGEQVQQYAPAKYVPLWSLFMEGLSGFVPPHDTSIVDTGSNKMPRPFDRITPGWNSSNSKSFPVVLHAAYPFELFGMKTVAAAGVGQFANLYHSYQNNNVMSPAINIHRPIPISYVTGSSTLPVEWYQSVTRREGSINRYGGALAVNCNDYVTVGVSGAFLKGSSDDYQSMVGRGHMTYYAGYFKVDSVNYRTVTSGTSEYSGTDFTLSATITSGIFRFGIALHPPRDITRKVTATMVRDTAGVSVSAPLSGEEKISYPFSGASGLSLQLKKYLKVTVEYEWLPYASLKYKALDGTETTPWRDASNFRAGVEFTPLDWLSFRFGARENSEVFEALGNPLEGEPVASSAYSAGVGCTWSGFTINAAYEYHKTAYNDMMSNTVYKNKNIAHTVYTEIRYALPF